MTFDAVGVFGLAFGLLFKSGSSYCDRPSYLPIHKDKWVQLEKHYFKKL